MFGLNHSNKKKQYKKRKSLMKHKMLLDSVSSMNNENKGLFEMIYNYLIAFDNDNVKEELEKEIFNKIITIYGKTKNELCMHYFKILKMYEDKNLNRECENVRESLKNFSMILLEDCFAYGKNSDFYKEYETFDSIDSFYNCIVIPSLKI